MRIVDAQIHLWGTGLPSNLSHWQVTHFTPEEATKALTAGYVPVTLGKNRLRTETAGVVAAALLCIG